MELTSVLIYDSLYRNLELRFPGFVDVLWKTVYAHAYETREVRGGRRMEKISRATISRSFAVTQLAAPFFWPCSIRSRAVQFQ
ncbi:unnamed protein product [Periconia digitata]|uniref:Uncharacterized protein n=1 Tax=Periconia digitata TaxID=1303443 RepID=A0A9W4XRD0_9PLEO|nr:unnamed protein product [Periconia digitata]